MSTDTMENAIAMEAEAILGLCSDNSRDVAPIIDDIRARARSILATLNEGDPGTETECGQCEGTGTTDAMGYPEECPVCDGSGQLP
jgi:hypothetical protein